MAKYLGATVAVMGIAPTRLVFAKKMGMGILINPNEVPLDKIVEAN